jgi:S1-C subfamily serine protease
MRGFISSRNAQAFDSRLSFSSSCACRYIARASGESVVAIGNPGDGMLFSATKGIVSSVGAFPSAGTGTWIQADAQINPR